MRGARRAIHRAGRDFDGREAAAQATQAAAAADTAQKDDANDAGQPMPRTAIRNG
jgi:hypothetical protein